MVEISKYLKEFSRNNQFVHQGNWDVSGKGEIEFKPLLEKNKNYCVYIWIARKKDQIVPLYFGKARNGVIERMSQHVGGFREDKNGSVSGRRKRKIIEKLLESNWEVEVYSRDSRFLDSLEIGSKELFDFNTQKNENIKYHIVSLYSFEEELLIRFFEENFQKITLMNGIKDITPEEFLDKINAL